METTTACPQCGATRRPEASDCPTCGIVFAKYRGPRMQAAPTPEPVTTRAPGLPANEEPVDPSEGVWRRGGVLVVSRLARLPDRCVSCNEPAETRIRSKLSWHRGWVYLFALLNLLVYAVVALALRKKAELEVPQCARHAKIRRYGFLGAWALMGIGTGIAWAVAALDVDGPIGAAPLLIFFSTAFVALIMGFTISRPVVARRIDDEFLWLGKCGGRFLSSLPEAPRGV